MNDQKIILKNVLVNNLRGVSLAIEPNSLVVFTGVSGSGKSSLAFETIFVEGQRRYIESLSTYARKYLGQLKKPEAEAITGISPTIAIEQKVTGRNPRSTVATMTGIHDFLRVLYARIGTPHCPISGEIVSSQSVDQIVSAIESLEEGLKILVMAPYAQGKKGTFKDDFEELKRKGFFRVLVDGDMLDLSETTSLDKNVAHDVDLIIDRLVIKKGMRGRLLEVATQALEMGKGLMSISEVESGSVTLFSKHAYSPKSGKSYPALEPHDFSSNHPKGMCPSCKGLGIVQEFDENLIIDEEKSIAEDCCSVAGSYNTVKWGNVYRNLARIYEFDINTPWKELPKEAKKVFLHGTKKKWTRMFFVHPVKGNRWTDYVQWRGVIAEAQKRLSEAKSEMYHKAMAAYMRSGPCHECKGAKIRPYPAATTLGKHTMAEMLALPISDTLAFFKNLKLSQRDALIGNELKEEITRRLTFLNNVGLHYLSLDRVSPTLSGGESQRVRLASQIGSGIVSSTYILDEPSIGLHQRDHEKLLSSLLHLRDLGNTVIVVEHDEQTMRSADWVVDIGPGAGAHGGEVIAEGPLSAILESKESLTGAYLRGDREIPIPKKRRKSKGKLTIKGARYHNLKGINVDIPLGQFVSITGVSGSGKSSLITGILRPALTNKLHHGKMAVGEHDRIEGIEKVGKIIAIDQSPIGRTPRSNPGTYIKVLDEIRALFAKTEDARAMGYPAGRFSFNVREGSCGHCRGMGEIRIDMDFLEDDVQACPHCKGRRFDAKTLTIEYKGKTIYDVLEMSVNTAYELFENIPGIARKLNLLKRVGMGYIKLGQSATTLSGGEAQRIKLAKELSRISSGDTLYILDEPTTGLHFEDIGKLIDILQELTDQGNSVVVIEHNLDLIKTSDWIIDLGPEGGAGGGTVIAQGSPEKVAKEDSPTATFLRQVLTKEIAATRSQYAKTPPLTSIVVKGARQNNLKGIDVEIPHNKITICTGPSGSGKTSLALDTIYAEGQRRYIESLSTYAKQFLGQMQKPQVESIEGLSPSIAIEQKKHAGNPRSTVGTMTEIHDYLRILFARNGTPFCPETGEEIRAISSEFVMKRAMELPEKSRVQVLAPLNVRSLDQFTAQKERFQKDGYLRMRYNGVDYPIDEQIPFNPKFKHPLFLTIDRIAIKPGVERRLLDAIDIAKELADRHVTLLIGDEMVDYNLAFAVVSTGKSYPSIGPHTFSFNAKEGMCLECSGLGYLYGAHLQNIPEIMEQSPVELMGLLWKELGSRLSYKLLLRTFKGMGLDPDLPLEDQEPKALHQFLKGSDTPLFYADEEMDLKWVGIETLFAGLAKTGSKEIKETLTPMLEAYTCPECNGHRLNPLASSVKLNDHSICDVCEMPIAQALAYIERIDDRAIEEVLSQLKRRLQFLIDIGLTYLTLNRSAPTLSGGETQRIRLSRQLGCGLTGCLYVLDEPTIGLHPHNNHMLNTAMRKMCDAGSTLVLVEHDPMTICTADHIIDFGPAAGDFGGEILAQGSFEEICNDPDSITGQYLSGQKQISPLKKRKKSKESLKIKNARLHNLQKVNVSFPIGRMSCITGISGSGKSTLLMEILKPAMERALSKREREDKIKLDWATVEGCNHFAGMIAIDQNPIGHTKRSDVCTYVDILAPLRSFFAQLPDAKMRGLQPRHFSFNHPKGMCSKCQGMGYQTVELQFMAPVKVKCETCNGERLAPLSLKVRYQGKSLGNILEMSVEQALEFLPPISKITRICETLISIGLGYLELGREVSSLSAGEAQRLRLSKELIRRTKGKTLYLFDEPTTGLHFEDIERLMQIFSALVDKGHTVIMIEHNIDVITRCDHLVDIGPGAGLDGGRLVAAGPPDKVAKETNSLTAKCLQNTSCRESTPVLC